MRNRTYGGVRGRKTKVGEKLLRFPPTRFLYLLAGEYRSAAGKGGEIVHTLCYYNLSRSHETVVSGKQRQHIRSKLYGGNDNGHAAKVCQGKARHLPYTDVSVEQFIHKTVQHKLQQSV